MATITNSEVIINRPDISNFNRRIREKHTTSLGTDYIRTLNYTFTTDPADYIGNDVGYQAALAAEYAPVLAQHATKLAESFGESEAEAASDTNDIIAATDYADITLVAIHYLRKAYNTSDSLEAYKKFDKFNDFRVAQGWAINQVVAGLTDVGLTQEEWDLMYARYAYLSNAQRVTAMENYQLVMNGDIWSNS